MTLLKKRSHFLRIVAFCLAVIMAAPIYASAAAIQPAQTRASDYLTSYQAYTYCAGTGKMQVWFDVTGVNYMDDIGALSIYLYESTDNSNWTQVKYFSHAVYTDMLGHDKIYYASHVDYQGVIGRYYKAYVCIWAGKDGGGDTRYFWTSAKLATRKSES